MPTHLRPTAAIAQDAILTGDPKRAMDIASALFAKPLMSNLSRGLWGYHGTTTAGRELTVQSAGIGSPSAAVVLEELAALGVRRVIRVGTGIALDPRMPPGAALVVERALAFDGVSASLGAGAQTEPDGPLTLALSAASGAPASVVATTDLHYDPKHPERRSAWAAGGASAIDLSSAAVFAVGRRLGIAVACALVIAESGEKEAGDELVDERSIELANAAAAALDAQPAGSDPDTPRLP
jgi:uridine phosphorylase